MARAQTGDRTLRVFLSYTEEFDKHPDDRSYVRAALDAVRRCGHVAVDMKMFDATWLPAVRECQDSIRGCDAYIGLIGFRYGTQVPDDPQERSYAELEHHTAEECHLPRLIFYLADNAKVPIGAFSDPDTGSLQKEFRTRACENRVAVSFDCPEALHDQIVGALRDLVENWDHRAAESRADAEALPPRTRPTSKAARDAALELRTGLMVVSEDAYLSVDAEQVRARITRHLLNRSDEPQTQWLLRIAVQKYFNDPVRSADHAARYPLDPDGVKLQKSLRILRPEGDVVKIPSTRVKHISPSQAEVWLEFERDGFPFSLMPDQEAFLEYSYEVSTNQWGPWWRRVIRRPTHQFRLTVDFPACRPDDFITTRESTQGRFTFKKNRLVTEHGGRRIYSWEFTNPVIDERYSIRWSPG